MDKVINLKGEHTYKFRLDTRTPFVSGLLLKNVNADATISVVYNQNDSKSITYMENVPIKVLVEYFAKAHGRTSYIKIKGNVFSRVLIPLSRNGGGLVFKDGTTMDITLGKLNSRDTDMISVSSLTMGNPYKFLAHEVPKFEHTDIDLTGVHGLCFKEDFEKITLFKDYQGEIFKREVVKDEVLEFNEQFRGLGSIDNKEYYSKMFVNVYPVSSCHSAFIQGTNKTQLVYLYY